MDMIIAEASIAPLWASTAGSAVNVGQYMIFLNAQLLWVLESRIWMQMASVSAIQK